MRGRIVGVAGFLFLAAMAQAAAVEPGLQVREVVGEVAADVDELLAQVGLMPDLGDGRAAPRSPAASPGVHYAGAGLSAIAEGPSLVVGLGALALAGALAKLLWPLYTRLERGQLLHHPVRRKLLELVTESPGIHLEAARRAAGIGAGSAAHHVHLLVGGGLVREQRAGRFRRLYPADVPPLVIARDAALRQPRAAALYELVRANPGLGLREASRRLSVPASSLQWHAERLARAGLLQRRPDGLHPA